MTVHIEDKTTVAAAWIKDTDKTQPIEDGNLEVGYGEYVRVIPNPKTEPEKSFGVYGKKEGFGGWVSFQDSSIPDKQLEVGEEFPLTDGIIAVGTD